MLKMSYSISISERKGSKMFYGSDLEDTDVPHACKKHKSLKEYDKSSRFWSCPKCWAEENWGVAEISYLKPKWRRKKI